MHQRDEEEEERKLCSKDVNFCAAKLPESTNSGLKFLKLPESWERRNPGKEHSMGQDTSSEEATMSKSSDNSKVSYRPGVL